VVAAVVPDSVSDCEVTLIVLVVPSVSVKLRLLEEAEVPVTRSVPPPKMRLDAALLEFPNDPATPPLPKVETLTVPELITVAPEYVLFAASVVVPDPLNAKPPLPEIIPFRLWLAEPLNSRLPLFTTFPA
jgi:hypothetical protein